jgi:beta-1,4-N-acetylglucosaminyltransferase
VIVVSLGTMHRSFRRLIEAVDDMARVTGERTVMQLGLDTARPSHAEWFAFRPRDEMTALYRDARVVVAHAGIGTVMEVLRAETPLIVVPRLARFGEHNSDHQADLAQAVEARGWGKAVYDIAELSEAVSNPPPAYRGYAPARNELIGDIRTTLARLTRSCS